MENLEELLKSVIESEKLTKEFLKQETLDEMYNFFLNMDKSITKEDFDSFIVQLLEKYNLGPISTISDDMLKSVSGGVSGNAADTKIIPAIVLSAFSRMYGISSSPNAVTSINKPR